MPALVRLYIRSAIFGVLLAAIFTGLLLALNVANLWHLVIRSETGALAVAMLVIFHAIVFSGAQFGIAVMRMAAPEAPGGGRRAALAAHASAQPVPVLARDR